jgi:transposase
VHLHANAKLVPSNRRLLVVRVLEEHWKIADVAVAFGISERTVYRWLARWRAGDRDLLDHSSAPKRVPRRTPRSVEALIEKLRRLRMTSTRIAAELRMAVSTVGAVLARLGLNRLSRLEPPEPPNRYCRRHPGELVHLDVKKLGRFARPGHRVTGRGAPGTTTHTRAGWEAVHVAVDDCTRLAYVEILTDERAVTTIGFLERTITWFAARGVRIQRVMSDNGSPYRSQAFATTCTHRHPPPPHPALPAPHQRQSRTLHPDAATRMGLRRRLPDQPPASPGAHTLARLLQPPTTTRRPRSPTTGLAATRRLTNVPGIYT